jgi:8-oxo-dGTP pyrophosphatase MutT (NUDIX family)
MPSPEPSDPAADSVQHATRLELEATGEPWAYATGRAAEIRRHWQARIAANPRFFDGRVAVLRRLAPVPGGFRGAMSLEAFSAFLHFRDLGYDDAVTLDGFATALLLSADRHVVLGRVAPGTLNAGQLNPPGGFVDARDIRPDGSIDIDGAVARELLEETGLRLDEVHREPGWLVTRAGRECSFALVLRSPLPAGALVADIRRRLAAADQELADVVAIAEPRELDGHPMPAFARRLVAHVLAPRR